jgi:hypothetical protein
MTAPTYQALTLEERLQLDQDIRLIKWQGIKARLQALRPEPPTPHTCGGMLFVLSSGDKFCLNCGMLP